MFDAIKKKVCVIDYGAGNINSVVNAFNCIGATAIAVCSPEELGQYDRIVLPGVGAFGMGMKNLIDGGWIPILNEEVLIKKKPFLGICLGMQLLASQSFEKGIHQGLNWIEGTVMRFNESGLRIPHIGWNDVHFTGGSELFYDLDQPKDFYFVHSYVFKPEDESIISGTCNYGQDFAAAVQKDNILAVQFHPEKSHKIGLKVLENFLKIESKCGC